MQLTINFEDKTSAELLQMITTISEQVTEVKFMHCNFEEKTVAFLTQLLVAIPAHVTKLDLSSDRINRKMGAELAQIMAAIPLSVTSLCFNDNGLGELPMDELVQFIAALPRGLTSVDLSFNLLVRKSGEELARILVALPHSVISVDLGLNDFDEKSYATLSTAIPHISPNVRHVVLSFSCLGFSSRLRGAQAKLMSRFPPSVESLDLSSNNLGLGEGEGGEEDMHPMDATELFLTLNAIPPSVISIDLQCNNLENLSIENINVLRSALKHVQKIYLSLDEIEKMLPEKRTAFRGIFPDVDIRNIFLKGRDKLPVKTKRVAELLGFAHGSVPPLTHLCAFFVKNMKDEHHQSIDDERIPEKIKKLVRSF